jgi:hypothetical protein
LDRINPSISPQLAAIVARCLARNPNDRYADMDALINALDHPESVDLSILDKLNTSTDSSQSLMQIQTIKGVLAGLGIVVILVVIALFLQQFQR